MAQKKKLKETSRIAEDCSDLYFLSDHHLVFGVFRMVVLGQYRQAVSPDQAKDTQDTQPDTRQLEKSENVRLFQPNARRKKFSTRTVKSSKMFLKAAPVALTLFSDYVTRHKIMHAALAMHLIVRMAKWFTIGTVRRSRIRLAMLTQLDVEKSLRTSRATASFRIIAPIGSLWCAMLRALRRLANPIGMRCSGACTNGSNVTLRRIFCSTSNSAVARPN